MLKFYINWGYLQREHRPTTNRKQFAKMSNHLTVFKQGSSRLLMSVEA